MLEHRLEVVPLIATVGNGLEVKCDVTSSNDVIWRRNGMDLALLNFPGISVNTAALGVAKLYNIRKLTFGHAHPTKIQISL